MTIRSFKLEISVQKLTPVEAAAVLRVLAEEIAALGVDGWDGDDGPYFSSCRGVSRWEVEDVDTDAATEGQIR